MNYQSNAQNHVRENVLSGAIGAFLFALVGGALYFVIYMLGYIAGISGLVAVICAIKGYALFTKKESIKGVIIASVIAFCVMVIAWYFSIGYTIYEVYQEAYIGGEIDFYLTFFESMRAIPTFFEDGEFVAACIKELLIGLVFCLIASISYIITKVKEAKRSAESDSIPVAVDVNVTPEQPVDISATEEAQENEAKDEKPE